MPCTEFEDFLIKNASNLIFDFAFEQRTASHQKKGKENRVIRVIVIRLMRLRK